MLELFETYYKAGQKIKITWKDGLIEESIINKVLESSKGMFYTYYMQEDNRNISCNFSNEDINNNLCMVEII
jgi:hypothetical protein